MTFPNMQIYGTSIRFASGGLTHKTFSGHWFEIQLPILLSFKTITSESTLLELLNILSNLEVFYLYVGLLQKCFELLVLVRCQGFLAKRETDQPAMVGQFTLQDESKIQLQV